MGRIRDAKKNTTAGPSVDVPNVSIDPKVAEIPDSVSRRTALLNSNPYIKNILEQGDKPYWEQVKDNQKKMADFLLPILRAFPRAAASVGASLAEPFARKSLGRKLTTEEREIKPQTKVEEVVLGKEPVRTLSLQGERTKKFLTDLGAGEKFAGKVAVPLAFAGTALDLIPGVGGAEKKVGQQAVLKTLAGSADEAVIKNILKTNSIKDLMASDLAKKIKDITDVDEIKSLLQKATGQRLDQVPLPGSAAIDTLPEELLPKKGSAKGLGSEATKLAGEGSSLDKSIPQFDADQYVKEQLSARNAAREAGSPGIKGKVNSFLSNAKTKLVDFTAPIEDLLSATVKKNKIQLKPSEDIHNQIDRVLRAPTIAGEFARANGIADVIKDVDNVDKFDQFLIARHALDLAEKGIETGRDLTKDRQLVDALANQYEPYAKVIQDYSQKLLDYSTEAGLINPELTAYLKAEYPNYVPFNRVFSELEKADGFGGSKAVASLSKQSVVQGIKGSKREIESPLESLLAKTNDSFKQGEKNVAGRILASYRDLPDNPFQLRELEPGETAKHTISYLDNGIKRTFETSPEIAQAAKALDVQSLNILGKIFALPVRAARIGITGINLPFVASNITKDQITAFINSDKALATSLANPTNFVRGLFSAVKHDDLYHEMVAAAGGGTSFDIARDQTAQTIKSIRSQKNIGSRALYLAKNPGELLKAVEDIVGRAEEATRIQQYRGTKNKLIAEGMAESEAKIAAARAARENTVNFARHGEWGKVLNSAFLYLNSGIQGTRTLLRNLKEKPVQTATKIAIAGMLPVANATIWNLSDPKRREAYNDIAEYEKQNNIIIVPPNPKKGEDGRWNVIKIPLSPEINNIVSLARRPIEAAYDVSPLKFKDFSNAVIGTVSPVAPEQGAILSTITPQAIKPTLEGAVNESFFTGFPQVPKSMEKLSPELQVKDNTSGTARKIGKLLNISPIKAEEWIKGTFGGVGSQALNVVDHILAKTGVIPEDQIGGQELLDAITSRFSKARGGYSDQKLIDDVSKLVTKQADTAKIAQSNAEAKWQELKSLPKDQAAKQFTELTKSNPVLAQNLLKIAEDEKLGLTYGDRLVKQLQVKNGERAKYIASKLNALDTKEEKAALYSDYIAKKIITKDVAAQVASLLEKNKK